MYLQSCCGAAQIALVYALIARSRVGPKARDSFLNGTAAGSDPAIPAGGCMDRFSRSYPWALAALLVIATAAAFALLAHALTHGQVTLS